MASREIATALMKLAVATREKLDAGVLAVYEEDLAEFDIEVIEEACARLRKTEEWFPKVAQVIKACKVVRQELRDIAETTPLPLALPMTEEERHRGIEMREKFLGDLKTLMQGRKVR